MDRPDCVRSIGAAELNDDGPKPIPGAGCGGGGNPPRWSGDRPDGGGGVGGGDGSRSRITRKARFLTWTEPDPSAVVGAEGLGSPPECSNSQPAA